MTEVHREVVATFDVDEAFEVPGLPELVRTCAATTTWIEGEPENRLLRATCYDTDDLALARHGLGLRRRVGGGVGGGWHLTVPREGAAPSEVRLPPGRAGSPVPTPLRRMVRGRTLDRPLVPVVQVTTRRTVRRLLDADARPVLELADDRVRARRAPPPGGSGEPAGPEVAWRELTIQALDGASALRDAAVTELGSRGLRPAPRAPAVARVLGLAAADVPGAGRTPAGDGARPVTPATSAEHAGPPGSAGWPEGSAAARPAESAGRAAAARPPGSAGSAAPAAPSAAPEGSAASVTLAYLRDQVEQVRAQDLLVRLEAPDSVHRMRVATRRLRSALGTHRTTFAREVVRPLVPELRWLAGALGAVRDAEVMRERVAGSLQAQEVQADAPAAGGAHEHDLGAWDDAYGAAREALLVELDGERYGRLLRSLVSLVTEPAVTEHGRRPARKVLRRGVAHEYSDVRRLVRRAAAVTGDAERAAALHDARKAAKRARYAAELASEVVGRPARAFAAAMESTQELLGRHQDSVVLRERLRALAASATDPRTAFEYGRLHALEEVRAQEAEDRLPSVWREASRKRLRRWLR